VGAFFYFNGHSSQPVRRCGAKEPSSRLVQTVLAQYQRRDFPQLVSFETNLCVHHFVKEFVFALEIFPRRIARLIGPAIDHPVPNGKQALATMRSALRKRSIVWIQVLRQAVPQAAHRRSFCILVNTSLVQYEESGLAVGRGWKVIRASLCH